MRTIVALLAFLAVGIFGQAIVYSNTNVTLTNGNEFTYRNLQFTELNIPALFSEVSVASTSISLNPGSAALDGVYAVAGTEIGKSPFAWALFVDATAKWTGGTPSSNVSSATIAASDAFIGKVFISLDEVETSGTVIQTVALSNLLWSIVDNGPASGNLRYVTFQGVVIGLPFTISITYIASAQVGVLNVGPLTVVTPKSFESIVNISNFNYINTANTVRMNIGVASQASTVQATAQFTHFAGGTGNTATYFSLSNQAVIGGTVKNVNISAFQTVDSTVTWGNSDITVMATAKYANAVSFNVVSVTFPAGATSIVYDPAIGAGATPPQITNSAATVSISFALLVLLVLLF